MYQRTVIEHVTCDRCGETREGARPADWYEISVALSVKIKRPLPRYKTLFEGMAAMTDMQIVGIKAGMLPTPFREILFCPACAKDVQLETPDSGRLLEDTLQKRLNLLMNEGFGIPAAFPDGDGPGEDCS